MRINFLNDGHRNCGGCLQFIKYANAMARMGHTVFLTYYVGFHFDLIEVLPQRIYAPTLNPDEIPDADVVISSSWYVAEKAASLPMSKGEKFYYVQDYENFSGPSEAITRSWRMPATKIVVANYLRELILQQTSTKAHVIPYGIDFEIFRPTAPKVMDRKEIVVGGLYNPAPRKRFTDLAAAISLLRQRGLPVKLELFGTDEKPGLPFEFEYQRLPSREKLSEMLNRCHVWLTMSDQEGLHIPPMEAMSCGAVPVVTNIGGMRDYCLPGKTGFTVPVGGIAEAADAIETLFNEPETWSRLSIQALDHIRSMGSERDNVDRMLKLFEKRIGQKAEGRKWLFDFTDLNQNTWKTLETYLEQAEVARGNKDRAHAFDLCSGVAKTLEERAPAVGGNHFLSLRGQIYGKALFGLERLAQAPGREHVLRALDYCPDMACDTELLERALGREILDVFFPVEPFEGFVQIWLTRPKKDFRTGKDWQPGNGETAFDAHPPQKWAEALNMHRRQAMLVGPDSVLNRNFVDMVNAVTPSVVLAARFPLTSDVSDALKKIRRELLLVVDHEDLLDENNLRAIKDNPLLSIDFTAAPAKGFHADPDLVCGKLTGLGEPDQRPKWPVVQGVELAYCRKRAMLVGPDGLRFHCVRRLACGTEAREGFFDAPFDSDISRTPCREYGKCAPCDAFGDTLALLCGRETG